MASNSGQPEASVKTTSVSRADLPKEMESSFNTGSTASGIEGLPASSASSIVKRGPNTGSRFLLDQAVAITGRHLDSDIFLDDMTVSRRHAEPRKNGDSCKTVGIRLLNGTYANREPKNPAVLANGDEVQVGKFRLVFPIGN